MDQLGAGPASLGDSHVVPDAGHLVHGDDLGVDEPVSGRYGRPHVLASPAPLGRVEFVAPPRREAEVGLRLTGDIAATPDDPLGLADAVVPFAAIEVVAVGSGLVLWATLHVLAWLVEHAERHNAPRRSGELVITATCVGLATAQRGEEHVGRVGTVVVRLGVA